MDQISEDQVMKEQKQSLFIKYQMPSGQDLQKLYSGQIGLDYHWNVKQTELGQKNITNISHVSPKKDRDRSTSTTFDNSISNYKIRTKSSTRKQNFI